MVNFQNKSSTGAPSGVERSGVWLHGKEAIMTRMNLSTI